MSGLAFVRLGEDLLLRLDTVLAAEETLYPNGAIHTRFTILGKKEPVIYHGPISDFEDKVRQVNGLEEYLPPGEVCS